jgi:tRNA (cytidine/uridine-2'-O-)-methyltransferase
MHLALYQPDIPQNTGTLMRLSACLEVPLHIIEPCGFAFGEAKMRRAAMDYAALVNLTRHDSWQRFLDFRQEQAMGRLLLLSAHASVPYTDFAFQPHDCLLLGRESAGAPPEVHAQCDARLRIPLAAGARSLNVAVAGAMVLGEALRQTKQFPAA